MRILLTGMTKQQVGGGNAVSYEPVSELFVKGFQLLGHEVEQRKFEIGERLDGYDVIAVGLVPFFSIASHHLYPVLDATRRAKQQGVPLIYYVDDWAFPRMIANLDTHLRHDYQLTKAFFKGRVGYDWAVENKDNLQDYLHQFRYDPWPPTIAPAFTWGNHQVMRDRMVTAPDMEFIDVSPLAKNYPVFISPPASRKRQWVLGTVSDQTKWLQKMGLGWEVNHLGTKTSKAPQVMKEEDLVQLYAESWGVLSPRYPSMVGTGWWRNRVVYAARTGAILLASPDEMPQLGSSYVLNPSEVEQLSDYELRDLADEQRGSFFLTMASKEDVAAQLTDVLERAQGAVA